MFLPTSLILVFILGLSVGSFLNVVGERVSNSKSTRGRSKCPHCEHKLAWYDLIPLISFVMLRARCRYCKERISWQYPAVELVTGITFVSVAYYSEFLKMIQIANPIGGGGQTAFHYDSLQIHDLILSLAMLLFFLFATSSLIIIFITDFKYYLIPNKIIIPSIIIALTYWLSATTYRLYIFRQSIIENISFGKYILETDIFHDRVFMVVKTFLNAIGGATIIAIVFLILFWATKGRGMGGGDFKLGFFISLVVGWPNMLVALFLGFISGALTSLALMISKRKRFGDTIPLGPFLCLSTFVVMLWGDRILNWYYRLFV